MYVVLIYGVNGKGTLLAVRLGHSAIGVAVV